MAEAERTGTPPGIPLGQERFQDLIVRRIPEIPEAVPAAHDPYQAHTESESRIIITSRTGEQFSSDGKVEFGADYDTRRIWLGTELELIYVHNTRPNRDPAKLYVHQFAEVGGLAARTTFVQYGDSAPINKTWRARSFRGMIDHRALYFARSLDDQEALRLKRVVLDPAGNVDVLRGLVSVNPAEQVLIDKNVAHHAEINAAVQRDMDAMDENRRRVWAKSKDIILY